MPTRAFVRVLASAVAALLVAACGPLTGSGDANAAAVVNGEAVPLSALEERFSQAQAQEQVQQQLESDPAYESQLQAQILSQLIMAEVLSDWAQDLGVEASAEEVDAERNDIIEQSGGQEAFDQQVEQAGLTSEQLDELLAQRVLQREIAEEVGQGDEVTDDEIAEFYEQNADARFGETIAARHILVEEEAKANRLLAQLREGADFAELAESESTDTGSGAQGGSLGEFGRGQMVSEFEQAAFDAEVGELVGPVQTEFGYHIIEVTDRTEGRSLDEVREEIRDELAQTRGAEALEAELRRRSQEAEVEVNPRFGTWNPETGQVEPTEPLGETTPAGGSEGALPPAGGGAVPSEEGAVPSEPVEQPS